MVKNNNNNNNVAVNFSAHRRVCISAVVLCFTERLEWWEVVGSSGDVTGSRGRRWWRHSKQSSQSHPARCVSSSLQITNRSFRYTSPYLYGVISLLHSVNLILFTLLLVHLILHISPHHSHHFRSHHLSLPRPFIPDLKLISFTDPFLHSLSDSFRTALTDLEPIYWTKWALAFVLVSSFLYFLWLRVLD